MYSEMDLSPSDVLRNPKPKKKYELSLAKVKNNVRSERNYSVKRDKFLGPKNVDKTVESEDSENFKLRLSDSFAVDDTCDELERKFDKVANVPATEVILISDSSDEGSPERLDRKTSKSSVMSKGGLRKSMSAPDVYTIKSSDSEDNDECYRRDSSETGSEAAPANESRVRCSIIYTSDEDITNDEFIFSANKKYNPLRKSKNYENKSRSSPAAASTKSNEYCEAKLSSMSQKFGELLNDENSSASKSVADVNNLRNVFYRGNDAENSPRTTPSAARNAGDSDKKLISSTERFRRINNDVNELETDSKIDSDERGIFNEYTNNKENRAHVTPTATINVGHSGKKLISSSEKFRRILTDNDFNVGTHESTKSSTETIKKSDEAKRTPSSAKISARTPTSLNQNSKEARRTPISARITSRTTVLTKKDTREILRAIKAKKAVYDSPKVWKKPRGSDASEVETSETENSSPEPIVKPKENIEARKPIVIAETDSDSDSDDKVIQGSRLDAFRPYKTHVTRFLEPATNDEAHGGLSEKKKLEVAKWLLDNPTDFTHDSSVSNISGSKGGSPNSGNSSLERLEENYETPNNRGKLKKNSTTEKPTIASNSARSVKSIRQTTIDDFVIRSKDGTGNVLTPVNTTIKKRDPIDPLVKEATESLGIMDCADILDNLYGNVWRARADDLLPSSEPRKPNVRREDKAVQTERTINPKLNNVPKKSSEGSSQEDEFERFMRNFKPNLNSTKKSTKKTVRRKCSFLKNYPSSDESGGETTYLTALTNPRISNIRRTAKPNTPASLAIQRVRAICDSDTDDETKKPDLDYRKQLSFSDDEDSSTSEYDPNDVLPSKTAAKPSNAGKTPREPSKTSKTSKLPVPKPRIDKRKTFLASLSSTVSLDEAHPDAKKYRQAFKTTKEQLCKYLYELFNEKVFDEKLPKDMTIEWNVRMRGTAGYCYNKRSVRALGGVTRSSRIVLATKIIDTPDRLRDTLIHEMCHAAAWLINEVSDGHGPFWKGWASKAMKAFPELPPIQRCHDYKVKTKFTYRCTGCGYSVGRHSKSLDVEKKRCGHCYGKFELLMNKVTKTGTIQVQTPTSKQPTGFALYVKENYHSVKKDRKGVAHKEVMQILGQQFSAIKISKKVDNNSDENNLDEITGTR